MARTLGPVTLQKKKKKKCQESKFMPPCSIAMQYVSLGIRQNQGHNISHRSTILTMVTNAYHGDLRLLVALQKPMR